MRARAQSVVGMEEERCSFGVLRVDGAEVAAPPAAQAASQHPTVIVDTVVSPGPEQPQEDQQDCCASPSHRGMESANDANSAARDPPLPAAQAHSPLVGVAPEATEGSRSSAVATSGNFVAANAAAAVDSVGTEMEAEVDAINGTCAPEQLNAESMPKEVKDVAPEAVTTGAGIQAGDAVGPDAAVEEAGDAGGAESDGKESNDSICNECGGGGEVVCCDGCVKSYHTDCLPVAARPRLRANADDWFCPDCASASAAPPPAAAASSPGVPKAPQGPADSRGSRQNTAPASSSPVYAAPPAATPWTAMPACVPTRRRKTKATEDYETRINVGPNHQVGLMQPGTLL